MKYGTSKSRVPAVAQPQLDDNSVEYALTPFGELMEYLDIVPGV
jgi:hypothetical protein